MWKAFGNLQGSMKFVNFIVIVMILVFATDKFRYSINSCEICIRMQLHLTDSWGNQFAHGGRGERLGTRKVSLLGEEAGWWCIISSIRFVLMIMRTIIRDNSLHRGERGWGSCPKLIGKFEKALRVYMILLKNSQLWKCNELIIHSSLHNVNVWLQFEVQCECRVWVYSLTCLLI